MMRAGDVLAGEFRVTEIGPEPSRFYDVCVARGEPFDHYLENGMWARFRIVGEIDGVFQVRGVVLGRQRPASHHKGSKKA